MTFVNADVTRHIIEYRRYRILRYELMPQISRHSASVIRLSKRVFNEPTSYRNCSSTDIVAASTIVKKHSILNFGFRIDNRNSSEAYFLFELNTDSCSGKGV